MEFLRWIEARDGPVTEDAVRALVKELGFEPHRVRYPPKTWIPPHSHDLETIDAVVSGTLRVGEGDPPRTLAPGEAVRFADGEVHDLESDASVGTVTLHGVRPAPKPALWRYLLLAGLIATANAWFAFHLGFELDQLVAVNGAIAVLPALLRVAGAETQSAHGDLERAWLARIASTPGLVALAAVLTLVTTFSSSAALHSSADHPVAARLVPERPTLIDPASTRWADPDRPTRFWRWTHPLGRRFTLEVEGYEPEGPFELFPWFRKSVRSEDLTPSITLVVRLDPQFPARGFLAILPQTDAWIASASDVRTECPEKIPAGARCFPIGEARAFFFGSGSRELPLSRIRQWRADLDETRRSADTFALWHRPAEAPENPRISPKDHIEIWFLTRIGACQGHIGYPLASDRLQDLYLPKGSCP